MTALLLEPDDVLFFRDGVPMSAGQGRGAGCRLPFPSTMHEAFRHALLSLHGREVRGKGIAGRDGKAIATVDYQSLRLQGPLPWHGKHGLLFPAPLDASKAPDGRIVRHRLFPIAKGWSNRAAGVYTPPALPAASVPPSKEAAFKGWWTAKQLSDFLAGEERFNSRAVATEDLWLEESRIGVEIEPGRQAAMDGQLFAGAYLRARRETRLAVRAGLLKPVREEAAEWDRFLTDARLLLGGERRLVRFQADRGAWPEFPAPKFPVPAEGPWVVPWILLAPAIFAHGSLPGWCRSTDPRRPLPDGRVCLRESRESPELRAHLVAWHLGRPQPVSGWDGNGGHPKATHFAVPAGSVYHFLCADSEDARRLVALLHDRHRSDYYGEKGCGHGLCAAPRQISPDLHPLAEELFGDENQLS